jgi:hypothetical protein
MVNGVTAEVDSGPDHAAALVRKPHLSFPSVRKVPGWMWDISGDRATAPTNEPMMNIAFPAYAPNSNSVRFACFNIKLTTSNRAFG